MSVLALLRIKHLTHTPDGRKLTPSEKGVLMQIADDHNEDRGYAWPSIPKLAVRVGLSQDQCRRLIRKLEKEKLIQSRPRLSDNSDAQLANDYRFWFDKPFDAASTAKTEKRLRLQAALRAGRPQQLRLENHAPCVDARGTLPPMQGGGRHGRRGAPGVDARGTPAPVQGQTTTVQLPVFKNPTTKDNSPLPPSPGGQSDAEHFTLLKTRLKQALLSTVQAKNFREIQPGESDYDACFRDWWLIELRPGEEKEGWPGVEIVTGAANATLCGRGMEKYAKRLETLARECFGIPPTIAIRFKVQPSSA